MSDAPASRTPPRRLEWIADLELECDGRRALGVSTTGDRVTLDIAGRAGLLALGRFPLKQIAMKAPPESLERLVDLLPERLELQMSGIAIGHYEPSAPHNWLAGSVGLPFGCLTIHKLALLRASLGGD